MESGVTKEFTPEDAETQNVDNTDSAETFQSFIYELFEKNGILNDLRAYLRGHIVNVLKSAQTGDPPACQKHFTQRLELTSQALNILIAEYLLRLEFSYSFSVFVSEIPLANMVFGFAKSLMEKKELDSAAMRFRDSDVWSVLNYLGVQCDSEHASNIIEMYRNDKQTPLLLCILKCMPMYREAMGVEQVSSEGSLTSAMSVESTENKDKNPNTSSEKCKHYVFCKTCQNRILKIKNKYKKKKKCLAKNKENNVNPINMESLIKNISVMEQSLIEEMFQQLKTVYETEVEMVKVEEEKKVKRSMATHALQLQQKRDEMEETFKAREAELERSVQQKKRFLWGLARALRDQHAHMTRAMRDVRAETARLSVKEDSLKSQLAEAEEILKKRGEEMRTQISTELTILEGHLESMKKERDNITKERYELENMKSIQDTSSKIIKVHNMDSDDVHSHYDLLKNELAILKKYLESSKLSPKCVIERGMVTEPHEPRSNFNAGLNNSQSVEKCSKSDDLDDRVKTNQVVNDFKKKNVNFSQSNLDEIYHERGHERSQSSGSSEAGDTAAAELDLQRGHDRDLIHQLREENERLKAIARQQRSHIEQLSGAPAPPCARPRTAPPVASARARCTVNRTASANTVNVGWRKGAGEELSVFSNAQPRILVPGDTLPFIGVLRDRHGNARRLATQTRAVRARGPLAGVTKRATSPRRDRLAIGPGSSGLRLNGACLPLAACSLQPEDNTYQSIRERPQQRPRPALSLEINRNREKSPKSVLREAKEKLRNKNTVKGSPPVVREKSPNSVLREAKLRLRKLEIEAEAVEQSYLDFRRRQSELRLERRERARQHDDGLPKDLGRKLDAKRNPSSHKVEDTTRDEMEAQLEDLENSVRGDFDKYLREYENKFDIGETHFRNKPTVAEKVKPIPEAYSNIDKDNSINVHDNYLETPLTEFRKLYTSARQTRREASDTKSLPRSIHSDNTSIASDKNELDYEPSARHNAIRKAKHNKQAELEILKQNISKMYNLPNDNNDSEIMVDDPTHDCPKAEENMLRVEVESISEINDIKSQTQELMLVVQSSVDTREVQIAERDSPGEMVSAEMTIIVSPKRSGPKHLEDGALSMKSSERHRRSVSPEQAAHLTRNDVLDAIFHADPNNHISSVQMQLELSKEGLEDSISDYEKGEEYPDDFSADVDNYNSRSDYENNSPISLPKTSEDDNFWDP